MNISKNTLLIALTLFLITPCIATIDNKSTDNKKTDAQDKEIISISGQQIGFGLCGVVIAYLCYRVMFKPTQEWYVKRAETLLAQEKELLAEQTDAKKNRENIQKNFTKASLKTRLSNFRECEKALAKATEPNIVALHKKLTHQIEQTNAYYENAELMQDFSEQGIQLKI